jgi:hypothetical protein
LRKLDNNDKTTLWINPDEIQDFVYTSLVDLGYVPSEDEMSDIVDIVSDFLINFLLANKIIDGVEFLDE